MRKDNYNFDDLISIMKKLRSENGCPWDKVQNHETLKKYLIEEAYEVLDTIGKNDEKFCEELGDVLLQVVFHSQIASERKAFDINSVVDKISKKMINRHVHVFEDLTLNSPDEVIRSWDNIKKKEKGLESYTEDLEDVPKSFPGLMRSYEIQKRAAKVGFDWDNVSGAIEKLKEEVMELEEAINIENEKNIEEELGDMLFAMVNVARFCKIQPEIALSNTIDKFINRFKFIEKRSNEMGKDLKDMSLEQMDSIWNEAKKLGKQQGGLQHED